LFRRGVFIMNRNPLLPVFCIVVVLFLSGCAQDSAASGVTASAASSTADYTTAAVSSSPQESSPPAETTPTPSPTLSPTPTPSPAQGVTEKKGGFLTKGYSQGGINYIVINYVDEYYGKDALKMAIQDKSPDLEVDENGDYYYPYDGPYIRDVNKKLRTFPLSPECVIRICNEDNDLTKVSWKAFCNAEANSSWGLLMHINVKNGIVVAMEEEYLE
jgi:hypothetical protein